jgi:hypothetical protein
MELLYYIYYKESRNFRRRSDIMFVIFQMFVFIAMPLSIINWLILSDYVIEKNDMLLLILLGVLLFVYDYIYYFRPTKRKEILVKFADKYEFIEQSTTLAYMLFFMSPLMVSMFICVVLNVKTLPWQ